MAGGGHHLGRTMPLAGSRLSAFALPAAPQ
jgi:hypothetical protein